MPPLRARLPEVGGEELPRAISRLPPRPPAGSHLPLLLLLWPQLPPGPHRPPPEPSVARSSEGAGSPFPSSREQ